MEKSKIETYLGFCIRARKIVFGVDDVEKQKRDVFLLVADETLGTSSMKTMLKAQETFSCPLYVTPKGVLGEILHRAAVKAAAIKDKNLALAICAAASEPQFKLYSGGNH